MRPSPHEVPRRAGRRLPIASPQDFVGGVFLLAIAAIGVLGSWELDFGQFGGVGSGMVPKIVAALIAAFGILLVVQGFLASEGEAMTPWSLRGVVFVLGAALLFAWTIRPLGLIFAGPITIVFAALADRTTRPLELAVFTVALTAFCIGLFSFALRLPIPILPTSLPYPINLIF
ncbi:MAG: tripartite tricarboxylate transporter TctB family protein [Hyphomicrobiaceae bacterium]|nr:tripartite tricarboxylate transporter TctB family protein [Hyphomicrobiaceae bacterium]